MNASIQILNVFHASFMCYAYVRKSSYFLNKRFVQKMVH